ncbi:response regulator [Pseudothauera nasutitermitis]|uniref:Response regulator n=1 Tax=Pseudothauera nasutitermitis TaxID=2565930 RepID=A0A4S4B407_9RHOO|nr:response regulator [Pseudothauera nasutitermitis]THF67402.1 response regulator [Pseudothauera nasutitermitis]
MTHSGKILIVDDHPDIRESLTEYLHNYGFAVTSAADGVEMRSLLGSTRFDLIVLDVMLPGEDGLSLCRYVSECHRIPVILLTAMSEQDDRIVGLEIGADDYVVKPFSPRELVARIKIVLRRTRMAAVGTSTAEQLPRTRETGESSARVCYVFEGWKLDMRRRKLCNKEGEIMALSTGELRILSVLVEHPNVVLSRNRLLDLTGRGIGIGVFDRSIDTLISRLRKKLEVDPAAPALIQTVYGEGYVFAANVAVVPA